MERRRCCVSRRLCTSCISSLFVRFTMFKLPRSLARNPVGTETTSMVSVGRTRKFCFVFLIRRETRTDKKLQGKVWRWDLKRVKRGFGNRKGRGRGRGMVSDRRGAGQLLEGAGGMAGEFEQRSKTCIVSLTLQQITSVPLLLGSTLQSLWTLRRRFLGALRQSNPAKLQLDCFGVPFPCVLFQYEPRPTGTLCTCCGCF